MIAILPNRKWDFSMRCGCGQCRFTGRKRDEELSRSAADKAVAISDFMARMGCSVNIDTSDSAEH